MNEPGAHVQFALLNAVNCSVGRRSWKHFHRRRSLTEWRSDGTEDDRPYRAVFGFVLSDLSQLQDGAGFDVMISKNVVVVIVDSLGIVSTKIRLGQEHLAGDCIVEEELTGVCDVATVADIVGGSFDGHLDMDVECPVRVLTRANGVELHDAVSVGEFGPASPIAGKLT